MTERSSVPSLSPIERQPSLADVVYRSLRTAILRGQMKPRERISGASVAEELGVSPTPVREALSRLEQDMLVERERHRGVFVTGVTEKDIHEMYELRMLLEGWAIGRAVLRRDPEIIRDLEQIVEGSAARTGRGERAGYAQDDLQFHTTLVESAGNKWMTRVANWINDNSFRVRFVLVDKIPHTHNEESLSEHQTMLRCIRRGDVTEAQRAMETHLQKAAIRTVQLLAEAQIGLEFEA